MYLNMNIRLNSSTILLCNDHSPANQDVLQVVKTTSLEAFENQDVPFEKIVENIQPNREFNQSPLFNIMFVLQNAYNNSLHLNGLKITEIEINNFTSKFDFYFAATEEESRIQCEFEYNTDILSEKTVMRIQKHFLNLLQEVLNNPGQNIQNLDIRTMEEKNHVTEINNTNNNFVINDLKEQFEFIAKSTPKRIALEDENYKLTYRELNKQANQLAHYLIKRGVKKGDNVGIYLSNSLNSIVSVLALIKIRACYVPIDINAPSVRISYILKDCLPKFILTDVKNNIGLPKDSVSAMYINLDEIQDILSHEKPTDPVAKVDSEDLIYIMYTSGTTGKPKGICMPYKSINNLIDWNIKEYKDTNKNVKTLHFTPIHFDVSIQEIFYTLLNSGTLYIIPENKRKNMIYIAQQISKQQITHVFVPSIILKEIADISESYDLSRLRVVTVAGDRLKISNSIKELVFKFKNLSIYNHYGPAETHVVSFFKIDYKNILDYIYPPIGKPIQNNKISIVDKDFKPLPIGIPGYILVEGIALSNNYLNLPKETAKSFRNINGKKYYNTGDIGIFTDQGYIEYIGREDNQHKIRGNRVEISEVESTIEQMPIVKTAACIVKEINGEKEIVAFIQLFKEGECRTEISDYLNRNLPQYMIPYYIEILESIPLNNNNKVNYQKLRDIKIKKKSDKKNIIAPSTELEKKVGRIWSDVLDLKDRHIDVRDSFFELGGHSIKAIQLISKLNSKLDINIDLEDLFKNTSIERLSSLIENSKITNKDIKPTLKRVNREEFKKIIEGED